MPFKLKSPHQIQGKAMENHTLNNHFPGYYYEENTLTKEVKINTYNKKIRNKII